MKNYDQSLEINNNPTCSYIPEHSYRILIIVCSGSGKVKVLLNLIKHQILTKFIYMSKIHSNQSINCLLMEEKK